MIFLFKLFEQGRKTVKIIKRAGSNKSEQDGKFLEIIKRAGSNKSEQGGKNLENS